jgi:hypothetical protein
MRLREFLDASSLSVPSEQRRAARAFLHTELFRASLDLSEFIQPDPKQPGMVRLSPFAPDRIGTTPVMDVLRGGILEGRPFLAGDGALGARGGIGVEVADPIERLRGVR